MGVLKRVCSAMVAIAAVGVVGAAPVRADVNSATPSPVTWYAGQTQGVQVTMQVSGRLDGSLGFFIESNPLEWSLGTTSVLSGTLAGDTLICANGITYQSSLFSPLADGVIPDVCAVYGEATYLDIYMETQLLPGGSGVDAGAGGTVVVTVPPGVLIAPLALGDYTFTAYGYNGSDVRSPFVMTVIPAPPAGVAPPSILQQVPLPASGECTGIDDAPLAWGTGLVGGWSRAWGEWANERTGGWVCSRTFAWSAVSGGWVIE